jgi:hypothetical protein
MRQLLMLGFYCEVYRREPLCRVYVNNVCVEEFNIPHTANNNSWNLDKQLDPAVWNLEQYQLQKNPPFIKFLELDDSDQRFIDLRVEIQNNNNNHANGFMTRHTRIILCQCWLAPVKVWEQFKNIQYRWKYIKNNWHSRTETICNYYKGQRKFVFDNLMIYSDMHFPDITQQPRSIEQLKSNFSNAKDLPQLWQNNPAYHWVGSSGHYHLTLTKKLGFWRHSTDRRRGWWKLSMVKNVKDMYDKYKK